MSQPNYGVIVGGNLTGAAAAGDHAQAVQYNIAPADPRVDGIVAELAKIREAIGAAGDLPERAKALRDVDALTAEVRQADPDHDALSATFARLVNRVKPVADLAPAVYQVWALVEKLLGSP
ncbi:DUF5955 family protein [Asanoa sp. NPDC050611]|uniref:DUF5955 family protein n=1 Tax=Asanoa sp. NPDC050611 TaxID=3157098 RepID=UPI0033F0418F